MANGSRSVLLVEDEILVCWVMEDVLKGAGHDVHIATSGNEGLSALLCRRFDLLVTNIRLTDGPDGWELARRARELHPAIGVLFVSGDSASHHSARGVPGSIMLSKPFEPADIERAAARLLEGEGSGGRGSNGQFR